VTTPLFWVVGAVSDRVGRKSVILFGCLLGALTFFPIYHGLTHYANPELESAIASAPVTVHVGSEACSVQFNPLGGRAPRSECDNVRALLVQGGVPFRTKDAGSVNGIMVDVGGVRYPGTDLMAVQRGLVAAGYPAHADPARINAPMIVLLVALMGTYLALVFAPLAAALVELFPGRIRYTALSFPYHLGNGLVGGFFPAIAFAIVTETGDIYSGLWYPVVFTLGTVVIGGLFLNGRGSQSAPDPNSGHLSEGSSTSTARSG